MQQPPAQWDPDLYLPGQMPARTGMTVFLAGPIGSIKTTWAATWPNPIFLSAGHEGGDDALVTLPKITGVQPPPVYHISSVAMMRQKLQYIVQNYLAYNWCTVVIDPVSAYIDVFIKEVIDGHKRNGKLQQMQQQDWAALEVHICKEIIQTLHNTRLNVIWIANLKEKWSKPDKDGESHVIGVEPLIGGITKVKLPIHCKMVIYADIQTEYDPVANRWRSAPIYRTERTQMMQDVRHKYGNEFPEGYLVDPEFGTWPTFRAIDSKIGHLIYKGVQAQ